MKVVTKALKFIVGITIIVAFIPAEITACKDKSEIANPSPSPTRSAIEEFAKENEISVDLANSLENSLAGMELTDKSRVGIFHYDLSDIESFTQTDDWAEGNRYTMSMAGEHIWIAYSKGDNIVGIKGSNGDTFYQVK